MRRKDPVLEKLENDLPKADMKETRAHTRLRRAWTLYLKARKHYLLLGRKVANRKSELLEIAERKKTDEQ